MALSQSMIHPTTRWGKGGVGLHSTCLNLMILEQYSFILIKTHTQHEKQTFSPFRFILSGSIFSTFSSSLSLADLSSNHFTEHSGSRVTVFLHIANLAIFMSIGNRHPFYWTALWLLDISSYLTPPCIQNLCSPSWPRCLPQNLELLADWRKVQWSRPFS